MKQMSYHYGQLGLSPARGLPESYRTHLKLIVLDRRESRGVIHQFLSVAFVESFSRGHMSPVKSKKALGLRSQNTMLLRCVDCAGTFEKCKCKYSNQHAPEPHQWTDPQAHLCKVLSAVSPELKWVHPLLHPWPLTHYWWTRVFASGSFSLLWS